MVAKRWALLCGGNFYFDGKARNHGNKILRFPDLEGCVQDVHAMRDFLVCIGVSEIAILTATRGEGRPIEDEERWPTRQNIVRELNRITNAAAPGDLVYIHYSGHGIRRNAAPPDSEGDGMLGSALVMTDVLRGGPYLTAYHLGTRVRKMVEKGLRVTLVLDCCFSGRGIRNPELRPRTIPDQYDDSSLESDKAADIDTDLMIDSLAQRDTGPVQKSWLSNPTGCAILAACGPHEVAGEGRFGDSTNKHGAFTYGVLSILRGRSGSALPSHARVLDHVKTKFRELMVRQSPTVLGDGWYEFLGTASVEEGEEVGVSQGYDGPGAVHLSLYCFTASWGIRKLDPSHKEGRVSNLTGPGITPLSDLAMPMEIPPKSRPDDPSAITDIFTMFASSADHVSWDEICLSSLPVNGALDKYLVDATKDKSAYRDPGEVFVHEPPINVQHSIKHWGATFLTLFFQSQYVSELLNIPWAITAPNASRAKVNRIMQSDQIWQGSRTSPLV
ncbi:caspase domain-containing protein [Purpureocillium lilacinum]|uniref:Caspase domain-containing protein n=1 Tax=Purpureocillium lilacinum TaxID=33203 RepID=A0A179FK52_PURLI|nr:caspase domain-containing protein [Purpureocillium lilacinum]OAQ65590.1 caspase domain-containing protein [Purpureocillium lilacinum]